PRPLDRVLPFLDPLLRRPAPVVEGDDPLGGAAEVRDDEAHAGVQLARMPLDLRDDPTRSTPALRPVAEARIEAPDVVRGATDGPREERGDLRLEPLVGGQANRVLEALRLQVLVYVREREGRIPAQQSAEVLATIPRDHRVEHVAPAMRAVHVAGSERASFQVTVLVEHERRMIGGGSEVAVQWSPFLCPVGR